MLGVILVMSLVFIVLYVIENNPNNKTAKSKIGGEEGVLSDKNQHHSIIILRNEAIALVNILYNHRLLSLKQTTEKRYEINKIDEQDNLNIIIKDQKQKVEQFEKEVKEKKAPLDTQQKDISKNQFISNALLSILSPVTLFIITFYVALEVDKSSAFLHDNPFHYEHTWWVWAIYLIIIIMIEKKLFSIRKRSKYFKSNFFKVLFYLSTISTIAGSVLYFVTINVQLFSRRSTVNGYRFAVSRNFKCPFTLWDFRIYIKLPAL